MTAGTPEDEPVPYRGVIVIEWPPPVRGSPYTAMAGWGVKVSDAVTGKPVTTCSALTVRAAVDGLVAAELELWSDTDGIPVLDGGPVIRGGEPLKETFAFLVSEMRVRSA